MLTRPRFYRIAFSFICVVFCLGCDGNQTRRGHSTPSIKRILIFDLVASTPDYSNAIAAADLDLPGDVWAIGPFRINESRSDRVAPIAKRVLEEVRPKLKRMSILELVHCLKVEDGSGFIKNYVADYIYPEGNEMIIAEMRSRPAQERQALAGLPFDSSYLETGPQGPPMSVDEIVRDIAPTNNTSEVHR